MNRRHFHRYLLAGLPFCLATPQRFLTSFTPAPMKALKKPPALRPGDTIGLIAPASAVSEAKAQKAVQNLEKLGFKTVFAPHALGQDGFLAASDQDRLADIHQFFADPQIHGIWCLRGGYGTMRLLPQIDYRLIRKNPKVLIGYSDITALLLAVHQHSGLVCFHGPVASSDFTDTTVAYLVSNREGTQYLDRSNKSCCYDIFRVKMPVPVEETPEYTEVDLPPITDSLWIDPVVSIPDPVVKEEKFEPTTLEDFLPLALYFDNDEPDRRTRRTTTRKSYGETFDRYYGQKPIYVEEYSSDLEEEERWRAQEEMEAFFDAEVYQNREWLDRFSEILLLRLEAGEQVEIFIKGFTSPRANSDYNLRLGQRRISSVRNHFFQYRDGIFLPYLNRTQLILSERSFGETSADQSVSADLNDRRNSIYSIGAARERRVEILEVVRNKFK